MHMYVAIFSYKELNNLMNELKKYSVSQEWSFKNIICNAVMQHSTHMRAYTSVLVTSCSLSSARAEGWRERIVF